MAFANGSMAAASTCANHGSCVAAPRDSPKHSVCECRGHWGGVACDVCKAGFTGADCDLACPSRCSAHGNCTLETHGSRADPAETAVCKCDDRWNGTAGCGDCTPGLWGAECQGTCPVCYNNGTCDGGVLGLGGCLCPEGWAGPACDTCAAWFWDASDDPANPSGGAAQCIACPQNRDDVPCSGRGQNGECPLGVCVCSENWGGADCSIEERTFELTSVILWIMLAIGSVLLLLLLLTQVYLRCVAGRAHVAFAFAAAFFVLSRSSAHALPFFFRCSLPGTASTAARCGGSAARRWRRCAGG